MSLDSILVTIELVCSHFSGKKKVYRDGRLVFETQKFGTAFQYPFQIGPHMLNIVQHGDHFELRVDNQSFSHLYHMDRTKEAFIYEGEPPREEPKADKESANDSFGYGNYKKGQQVPDWQGQT